VIIPINLKKVQLHLKNEKNTFFGFPEVNFRNFEPRAR